MAKWKKKSKGRQGSGERSKAVASALESEVEDRPAVHIDVGSRGGDLADSGADVIEAMKRLETESKKPEFFNKERVAAFSKELEHLQDVLGKVASRFAQTEKGQEVIASLMDTLGEKTGIFGKTAASAVEGAAAGFATGGPIGAGIGGLTGLVKIFAEEYVSSFERIEKSNRELAAAEMEAADKQEKRRRTAVSDGIARMLEGEQRLLDRQTATLQTNAGLWDARKGVARSRLELEKAQAELEGKDTTAIERKQIDEEEWQDLISLGGKKNRAEGAVAQAEHARDVAADAAARAVKNLPPRNPEIIARTKAAERANAEYEKLKEQLPGQLEEIKQREEEVRNRAQTERIQLQIRLKNRTEPPERTEEIKQPAAIPGAAASPAPNKLAGAADELVKMGEAIANDPTAGSIAQLAEGLAAFNKQFGGKNADLARSVRQLQDEMKKLQGHTTKGGDGQ